MFKKIKDALFPQALPTEQDKINERNRKISQQLEKRGPFGLTNHAHEWYGYTWKEIFGEYFGYYHWQGQFFLWREHTYDGEAVSLLEMGQAFAYYFASDIKKPTTNYPTPEETAFIKHTKTLWEKVIPTFRHMDKKQAIEIFFTHCLGPDTPLMQQEYYNLSCPFELTYLFHTNRARCTSMGEARRLDQAYYEVFRATMAKKFIRNDGEAFKVNAEKKGEADFLRYMDHPYSPVLDGTLDAVIPLPGVEEELTLPDHAFTHAKFELIVLNNLLAGDYAVLREYLGMTGTRLSDYQVGTKAYAVGAELDGYAQFVTEVRNAAYGAYTLGDDGEINSTRLTLDQAIDRALYCVPLMLNDIKAIFDPSHDMNYRKEDAWKEVPRKYMDRNSSSSVENSIREEMETHSDWLQERRDEMARIFEQFAYATGVKPPTSVVVAVPEPVIVKMPQEDVMEAPTTAIVEEVAEPEDKAPALVPDMSVDEALSAFVFDTEEDLELSELTRQYKKLAIRDGLSSVELETIDAAYLVLKAHLEKKVAYQQERSLFGYGLMETFTRKDLDDRYTRLSKDTDSKAKQKLLDEAYQVLLKIAA